MRQVVAGVTRSVGLLTVIVLCSEALRGQDERPNSTELPKLEDMRAPRFQEIMESEAFENNRQPVDWIVLKAGTVIVSQPVYPRTPYPDPLTLIAEQRAELEAQRPRTKEQRDRRRRELDLLKTIEVELTDGSLDLYRLPTTLVDRIIPWEQLILQEVDRQLESGEIRKAYDLLTLIDPKYSDWQPVIRRFENLLLRESELRDQEGNPVAALSLLDELAERNIENEQLPVRYSSLIATMASEARQQGDWGRVRYLVSRLARWFPEHPTVSEIRADVQQQASQRLREAVQLSEEGRHREAAAAARQAEAVWPASGNDRAVFIRLVSRHQLLTVGVTEFSDDELIFPLPTPADVRHRELTVTDLFEPSSTDGITYFRSTFFEKWEPADLGREVVFSLRGTRPYWQTQPILSANQIADTLSARIDPNSPLFDPRTASFVREFAVRNPSELLIRFSRVPMNLEGLFRFPVVSADSGNDAANGEPQIVSTRFALRQSSPTERSYQRVIPEPDGLESVQYHVAEIREQIFTDRHQLVQSFVRGEVDYIPHLLPNEVEAFRESGIAFVNEYQIPMTHILAFNPASEDISSAQVRRALSLAVNREGILRTIILKDNEMKHGRPASSPWHSSSYASSPLVEVPEYNIRLAFALRFAADKQLQIAAMEPLVAEAKEKAKAEGNLSDFDPQAFRQANQDQVADIRVPVLKMLTEPNPAVLEAAKKMQEVWERIGFRVEIVPGGTRGETPEDWDIVYRRVQMEEPLFELWPVLTCDDSLDVELLKAYPDWLRQELIDLDYATSFADARDRMYLIHRHLAAQGFIIPLWEVDQYSAVRKAVSGFNTRPLSEYHDVERWSMRP